MPRAVSESARITTCDSEPIHVSGAIQPFGFLLSVNSGWIVARASDNAGTYLDVDPAGIVGTPATTWLSVELLHDIRGRLQLAGGLGIVERLFARPLVPGGPAFDIAVHRSGRETVIEFEASTGESAPTLPNLRAMIARVERHRTPAALYTEAARQMGALTGFDRVMVYRFAENGTGEVVAEALRHGLPPYLGLRYPASDIPSQARALYERNFLRIIADVDAVPVPVTPARSPEGDPLDLSMSVLRSVSPIHLEYLRHMGVRASMSISVMQGGKLWGLIACHHGTPRSLDLELRSTAEMFGQMFSYLLEMRQREEQSAYDAGAREIHARIAAVFAAPDISLAGVPEFVAGIGDYIRADGIGIYHAGTVTLTGITPTCEEFLLLIRFLNTTVAGRVFATHHLSAVFPPAADFTMRAAGLLSIPISRSPRDYLVFFRREIVQAITWAGEPEKIAKLGPSGVRLTPRKSFEAWREIVLHQCERWAQRELDAAEELRRTLVDLVLRLSDTAQADRVAAEQRQEILIAELNHRVRNILGLVRGLITQSAATASDIRVFVEGLEERIRSLGRAHDLLTSSSWGTVSLHALTRAEIETYNPATARLELVGPDVLLQPKAFSAMALVVHELVTNARKYGALSSESGRIVLETVLEETGNIAVAWREQGGPTVSIPLRRGFGSTILEQAVPFEVNGTSTSRYLPEGFALEIVLPAAVAHCVESSAQATMPEPHLDHGAEDATLAALLHVSLLVEDNLFIAVDAEDMLRKLGADTVEIVRSVPEALAALARGRFSFALLDMNLGRETGLPVARALQAHQIPFAFGTGYGDDLAVPQDLERIPIVAKPYHRIAMVKALIRLLPANQQSPDSPHAELPLPAL